MRERALGATALTTAAGHGCRDQRTWMRQFSAVEERMWMVTPNVSAMARRVTSSPHVPSCPIFLM